jgi:hypothetical protein
VKRRAAPKLIRTRRLANGEIIRSRAGQAVHDKFEQMQAVLSKSARRRSSRSPAVGQDQTYRRLYCTFKVISRLAADVQSLLVYTWFKLRLRSESR